jgi:aspartyl-tRNA(Asn)/glutamyl-tRNA(Gln) amidotransferase subunit C
MISLEEVKHIADLARIDFSAQELKQLQKELSSILDYIDKLKEVDIKEIKPTSHSALVKNVLRKDEAGCGSVPNSKNLVDLAPSKEKSFIKVKSVFQK